MKTNFSRRNFIKLSALSTAALGLTSVTPALSKDRILDKIEKLTLTQKQKGKSVIGLTASSPNHTRRDRS